MIKVTTLFVCWRNCVHRCTSYDIPRVNKSSKHEIIPSKMAINLFFLSIFLSLCFKLILITSVIYFLSWPFIRPIVPTNRTTRDFHFVPLAKAASSQMAQMDHSDGRRCVVVDSPIDWRMVLLFPAPLLLPLSPSFLPTRREWEAKKVDAAELAAVRVHLFTPSLWSRWNYHSVE